MNTDKSGGPGIHWVAMFCDPVGSKSIEYFDSFADPMPADVREVINKVVKKIKPTTFLKLKENGVVQQDNDTMNCGYFAINFLMKRHRGVSFADATGYNDNLKRYNAEEGEKEISKFKRKFALI
jgi:Ulp1 family protease